MKKSTTQIIMLFLILLFCISDITSMINKIGFQLILLPIGILLLSFSVEKISAKKLPIILSIITLLICYSFFQLFILEYKHRLIEITLRASYWIVLAYIFYEIIKKIKLHIILSSINYMIIFVIASILIQGAWVYFLKEPLDYSVLLGGGESRNGNIESFFRLSGFFAEPATYSAVIFCLVIIKTLIEKKLTKLSLIGLSSIILTQSTAGIIIVLLFAISRYFNQKNIHKLILFMAIMIFILMITDSLLFLIDRYERWTLGEDDSNNFKIEVIQHFFEEKLILFFGYGIAGYTYEVTPDFYQAISDLTNWIAYISSWGVIFGSLILFLSLRLLVKSNYTKREKMYIFIAFIKMTFPYFAFYPFFVFLLFRVSEENKYCSLRNSQ
jgi:hypothetical protein